VTIQTWSKPEYSVEVTVIAKGIDQAEANRHLTEFKAAVNKQPQGSGSILDLTYDYPDKTNPPYMVTVNVKLPAGAVIDLDVTSSNGQIAVSDISGKTLQLQTSNGQLQLNNLKADIIRAESSNGAIRGRVDAATCTLSTSNGLIELQMPVTQTGKYTLTTSNARISLVVESPAGYTVTASTSNAEIGFNLPKLTYSSNTKTYKSATTQNLEAYPVKVVLDLRTSNANVDVSSISSIAY
jgi:DUF4097 and DUF4098 domain-containing protein YvlB